MVKDGRGIVFIISGVLAIIFLILILGSSSISLFQGLSSYITLILIIGLIAIVIIIGIFIISKIFSDKNQENGGGVV